MKHLKIALSTVLLSWVFILNGCGGGSGGGTGAAPAPSPTPATVPVVTAFSINGSAGVITGNRIAITLPYGASVAALTATFTAPGSIATVGGIPQISGVSTNNYTNSVVFTVTPIGAATATSSAKSSISSSATKSYTVTVTVASISAKAITAFSLHAPTAVSVTPGIISILNINVTMPYGTNVTALIAAFTTSGASVTIGGTSQVSGTTQNDFTNPVTYTVTAANGTTQNYRVTVTVASNSANDIIAFSLNGTPGVISSGGLTQTIVVNVPYNTTGVTGLVATFITTGASVVINGVAQISGTTQNNFTNPVTYIVTAADGTTIQTYTVTVIVASASANTITAYSFGNISGVITGQDIAVTVPSGTNVTALVATFTTTGASVTIGGAEQTSTQTENNFTNPISYIVTAADGSVATYTVTVTVSSASAKAITTFLFGTTAGVITNESIAVTMPFGTDVTALIATFTTTGVSVSVGTVVQISNSTPNNFTGPVSYVVTAADGSTATYIVTVTVVASSAKAITAFSLAGRVGVITGQNIAVNMQLGQSLTSLIATFTTTGASVKVLGVVQTSGVTSNNFTTPVSYVVTAADTSATTYTVTATATANVWTWMSGYATINHVGIYGSLGVSAPGNVPGTRDSAVSWADSSSNLWLFGGVGYDSSILANLNDLWRFNTSTNQWTWVSGSNIGESIGIYGTLGVSAPGNVPGARRNSVSWVDASNNFWLFGGTGYDSAGASGLLNDMWRFNPSINQWTWMSGSNIGESISVYGSLGVPNANNIPGARDRATSWTDHSGNLWLFGGAGYASTTTSGNLGDLWKYNPSTNQWTWVSGPNAVNQIAVYGSLGVPSVSNVPGGRKGMVSWIDTSGNLWLFGGSVSDTGGEGYYNDLWKYNPSTNQWAWMSGANTSSQAGTYGTLGIPSASTVPGARAYEVSWIDNSGNLWLLGGLGYQSTSIFSTLNDFWKFNPSTIQWTWVSGSNFGESQGVYGTLYVPSASNVPGARQNPVAWTDVSGNFWMFGGTGYGLGSGSPGYLNDLWGFQP